MDLSALVVSWNTRDLLRDCLRSTLQATEGMPAEIIVVDNASADESASMVRREFGADPRVRLLANARNEGFARGNNQAYERSRGDILLMLNPDIVLNRTALRAMIDHLRSDPAAGMVSCDLVGSDGKPQTLHRAFPTLPIVFSVWTEIGRVVDRCLLLGLNRRRYHLRDRRHRGVAVIDQAAAACVMMRRSTIERLGVLFDERFPIFFNDVDLSRRVWKAGLEVHVLYDHAVTHHGGAAIGQMPPGVRKLEQIDGLQRYYDLHEPAWKARAVSLLVSATRRRVSRAGAAARA